MNYTIRNYKKCDYQHIIKFIAEELKESGEDIKKIDIEKIANDHLDFLIDKIRILVVDETKIAGWYRYSVWPRDEKDSITAHLFDISIVDKYRRKGFGEKLFSDLITQLKKKQFEKLYSCTIDGNQGAYNFHLKLGFKILKKIESKIIWIKEINNEIVN